MVTQPEGGWTEDDDDHSYLTIANEELRHAIIDEWEAAMSTVTLKDDVCAVCGRYAPPSKIELVKPSRVRFDLLCNDQLPSEALPISYSREHYDGAILHPQGLKHLDRRGPIKVCKECSRDLCHPDSPKMPRFALANWLYYGIDRVPAVAREAFETSTFSERLLVARARSSKVSYRFCELPGHPMYGTDRHVSQGCVKGNVAIHPQDAAHLSDVLPPSSDVIRDTLCAVFVGKTQPTKETIRKLSPVLVRKSRVKAMIDFLLSKNPHYGISSSFRGYSQYNMDRLFADATGDDDQDIPCAMEVGHIETNSAVEGSTEGYVPSVLTTSTDDGVIMENVGYIHCHDSLALNPRDMKLEAVAHCLRGRSFIKSQAGSRFVPDFDNPSLLSWLFPHLDPWGIGGFCHPQRERQLSLDQQLKYLLQVAGSPFAADPNFAFVYYNIRQKKAVYDSVTFRVSAAQRDRVIDEILRLDVRKLDALAQAFTTNPHYKPCGDDEIGILRVLSKVNAVAHDLPGSNGYKVALRNQIRGLIHREGTPTLFITLNPSDRDHPLVRLYAGHEIVLEDHMRGEELSRWKRSQIAANNPAACARFFDKMISNFIDIVLRFGRSEKGLFG
ncbi:hypothetical protein FKP32DRAFT_1561454, partial [Trametes sanguinea]